MFKLGRNATSVYVYKLNKNHSHHFKTQAIKQFKILIIYEILPYLEHVYIMQIVLTTQISINPL
jgi:hypothetical protein